MATLIDVVNEYALDGRGARKKWSWGDCDCIGLLFHVVNRHTGTDHQRASHIPSDLGYKDAVKWLLDAHPDKMLPFLKFIVDDAGIPVYNGEDWNLAIASSDRPIRTADGLEYPIHIVPGVVIKPPHSHPYVMGINGLVPVDLYPSTIKDFVAFKLRGFT